MSSIRTRPTVQPTGSMMLNSTSTITVKAAWPAVNEMAAGTKAAISTTNGSSTQSATGLVPTTASAPPR